MTVSRVKTYVRGFDEALGGGVPEGYVIVVSGAPGTMKSSFCYSILYNNAIREGRKSAYFTLEQGRDILLEHMGELGLADERASRNMNVLDMGSIRKNLNFLQARGTWIELFKMYASEFAKAQKISLIVLDSLDVMETMARFQDRRTDLYYLFEWLRDLGTTTLVVSERPMDSPVEGRFDEEAYLADGIIQLGLHPTSDLYMQRRVRCVKMRSTKHETGYYSLVFDEGQFEVTRAVGGTG
jgi:KaiC/GvpD/RAD55 family RecA-like ATPase